jgi:hypothetical protein
MAAQATRAADPQDAGIDPPEDRSTDAGASFAPRTPRKHDANEERIRRLMDLAQPAADDWASEHDAAVAHAILKRLASVLESNARPDEADVAPFLAARATASRPSDGGARDFDKGEIRVRRVRGGSANEEVSVADALRWLIGEGEERALHHVHAKVVAIRTGSGTHFDTTVLIEVSSESLLTRSQRNGVAEIRWVMGADGGPPVIGHLAIRELDACTSPGKRFVDRTLSLIKRRADWDRTLANGCEWWRGRVDALTGENLIGSEGIAVGDVNGDGLDDVYVCMSAGLPNKLFVQQGDGTIVNTAVEARVAFLDHSRGALWIDIDNDGDQDLVVAIDSTIGFCVNDGTGIFTPRSRFILPPSNLGPFYSLAAADYDRDGDLDIYACRYQKSGYGVYPPEPYYDANNGPSNHLLRNDGDARFVDVTNETGLDINNRRFSVVATWFDFDDDRDDDLYVANDFGRNNLYRNDGGRFTDVAAQTHTEDQASGMGISWSDFDLDGDFDLLISNMFSSAGRRVTFQSRSMAGADEADRLALQRLALGNTLLVNRGDGRFEDRSEYAGLRMGRWAWGAMFVDFDNDGFDDVVVPNGFLTQTVKDDL